MLNKICFETLTLKNCKYYSFLILQSPRYVDYFSLHFLQAIGELEKASEERIMKLQKYGLTLQPQIKQIGTLKKSSIYVYINGHKYRMVNLMGAVDFCFKTFYALDAQYPADCKIIWYFLQKYVFEVKNSDSETDDLFPSMISIWLDLQAVCVEDSLEVRETDSTETENEANILGN